MALSYSLRMLCLIAVSTGLIQIAVEALLWMSAPCILRFLDDLPVRTRERMLYLVHVAPCGLALLFTFFFCLPRYIADETNFASENIGWLCILVAIAIALWWTMSVFAGLRMALRTMRFTRACRRDAQRLAYPSEPVPVLAFAGMARWVALVGLMRPFILISKSLIEEVGLHPLALEVVLDHERSHAAQGDNWKLLSLHCLPRLRLKLPGGSTWMDAWQNIAEWAADDDAVRGDRNRAFTLAQTLVTLSRYTTERTQVVMTALLCKEAQLASRVERLIQSEPTPRTSARPYVALLLGSAIVSIVTFLVAFTPWLRDLPEQILQLR
jgi:hypothetical protein